MRAARRALRELERTELHSKGEPPINLVPMIDVMIVLTLYLLITTLVKHLAVIELNMPTTAPQTEQVEEPKLQLSISVYKDKLILSDRYGGLKQFPATETGYDYDALASLLVDIKRKEPEETTINLLFDPDIQYDVIVKMMDIARLWPEGDPEPLGKDLFPDIAFGDAPKLEPAE